MSVIFFFRLLHALMLECIIVNAFHVKSSSSSPTSLSRMYNSINNNNVVLEPTTDDPSAFDSFKIGNARIHRYSGTSSAAGGEDVNNEPHYVMWYHGRSKKDMEDPENEKLPPLSTGRIGRATSRNGLVWEKDRLGSLSEDITGVTLGLNEESWWCFDTAHLGLGNVLLPMSTPAVVSEGSVYLMYYMGGDYEESNVVDYMKVDGNIPDKMKNVKVQGMNMKIGVALSQDGKNFGRVEGDHPTGAVMVPYSKKDRNSMALGSGGIGSISGKPLLEELYCAWPEVVVDLNTNDEDAAFLMYYSTMTKDDKKRCIAYATSPDGFRWKKQGVCLQPDDEGTDAKGCARCCIIKDAVYNEETKQWDEKMNSWIMYYDGSSGVDGKHRILKATSQDGMNWTKMGRALDIGTEGSWDEGGVTSPHVIRMDDGVERLYYTGQSADGQTAIGVAKPTADLMWEREQAMITFA